MSLNQLPNPISKDYINSLPIIKFRGPIKIIDNRADLNQCLDHLNSEEIVGFDTETRPAFHKGQSYPISLIQLSSSNNVYIIQIKLTGFTPALKDFFENENTLKVGVAIHDDIKKLRELKKFNPEGFIDLSTIASDKKIIQTGLKALSARYLDHRISKSAQTSNWSRPDLTHKQKVYAATDAWISLKIYPHLLADTYEYIIPED